MIPGSRRRCGSRSASSRRAQQRGRVLNRADREMANDVPLIPLYQLPFVTAFREQLRNVVTSPFNVLWNAENWWLER